MSIASTWISLIGAIALTIAPLAGAQSQRAPLYDISGRVTDSLGLPIAGVQIFLRTESQRAVAAASWSFGSINAKDRRVSITAADGRFVLRVISANAVTISAARSATDGRAMSITVDPQRTPTLPALYFDVDSHQLPRVSITARSPVARASIPGATTSIGSEQLHARAPLSVADALRSVAGVHVADEDPYGLALNVGLRGLAPRRSSRTLLLEDGMPILLGPYGDPSMHYAPPLESLERIEIIKGSGQIMNGPQTLAGVVNFVTAAPPVAGRTVALTVGGGALDFRNARIRVGTGNDVTGVALDVTHREGAGVRFGEAHRVQNVSLTARRTISQTHVLSLKLAQWREASRTAESGLTQREFTSDPFALPLAQDSRFDVDRVVAHLTHVSALGRLLLHTSTYVSHTNRASWRQSGESGERFGTGDYADDFNCASSATSYRECGNQGRPRTYTVVGFEPRLELLLGSQQRGVQLDGGLRGYSESVRRRQYVGNAPLSREDDAALTSDNGIESRVLAGYLQTRWFAGMVHVTPGIRIERVSQEIRNHFAGREAFASQRYTQLLPGIGVSISPRPFISVFAGAHRGFAPPRPADLYRPLAGQPLVLVDPETSLNLELGSRISALDGLQFEATLFRMHFGNEIIEAPANTGQRFINGGRTQHAGVELAAHARLQSLAASLADIAIRASYTFLPTARFDDGGTRDPALVGNRLPYAPRHLATSSVTYAHRAFSIGASMEFVGAQFADSENRFAASADGQEGVLPAYTVAGAFGSYALPFSGWEIRMSARNLLNRVYITQRNEGIMTGVRRFVRAELHWRY